jgi:hypothetical protein
VGIRASHTALASALRSALAPHVVYDPDTPASFAIQRTQPALAKGRPTYRVFRNCDNVRTSPSLARALASLAGLVADEVSSPRVADGLLRIEAVALVGRSRAVVGPWSLPYRLPSAESSVRASGIRLLERGSIVIDPSRCELVVESSGMTVTDDIRDEEGSHLDVRGEGVSPGRYQIVSWLFEAGAGLERRSVRLARADALARALHLAYAVERPSTTFRGLAQLMERIPHLSVVRPAQVVSVAREQIEGR